MRFALLTLGSRGDTQPYAALALALKARGHQVTLCATENFAGFAQSLGLDFVPIPWDSRAALEEPSLLKSIRRNRPVDFFLRIQRQAWQRREGMWDAWIQACSEADVLVSATTTEDIALVLAQALGKRVVFGELAPFAPSSGYPAIGLSLRSLGPLNGVSHWLSRQAWWRLNRAMAFGLAKKLGGRISQLSPSYRAVKNGATVLHGFSPNLFAPPSDWPSASHPVTGAWRLESDVAQALPGDHHDAGFSAWLDSGPPPIFLGFGSMPVLAGEVLVELAGDVAELLETRVVLGAGWTQIEGPDCDLPEGVAIVGDCDYDWLFERCSAVVHHGGAGTTHTASRSGLPQVVCPLFADQPFWAQQVKRSGAGLVLPFFELSAQDLADTLALALEGDCQDAAVPLAEAMKAEGGAAQAAQALEQI